jgi:hypothetical protein
VWGINSAGAIFHFDFGGDFFNTVPGNLTQIAVGVNDMWGVNAINQVYRYNPQTGGFNFAGGNTTQVSAGGDGVWLVDIHETAFRFDSSKETFVDDFFTLKSISVGSGAGVFGVGPEGQVFTFVRP